MKSLRVLVLLHPDSIPPDSVRGLSETERFKFKTEIDVLRTLKSNGHNVRVVGIKDELKPIRDEIEEWKPNVVFNLLEEFDGQTTYDQNVASYLELQHVAYTGCNPRGLMLSRGKDLSKKLVAYHRIPVPAFAVFPRRKKVVRPPRLTFPVIVKTLSEDASLGIAQASVVDNDEKLVERVRFIHESVGVSAIAEHYIHGRELYVGVLGNERLRVLPIWELEFGNMADGAAAIATERVKHDPIYQEKRGIQQGPAEGLSAELTTRIQRMAKRICRTLEIDGYARIDFRLSEYGVPYFLEANPNPDIAKYDEFALSADYDGLTYARMIDRILALALARHRLQG